MPDFPNLAEVAAKIALAAILGGLVGAEREWSGKWAGLRTHMLIAVGAALVTHLSVHMGAIYADQYARWDPGRIAAQVVSGVGFLGAGTIIQARGGVRGLTTAAGLWVAAAVGMAVGGRFYAEAGVTAVVLLLVLAALRPLERRLFRRNRQAILVDLPQGHRLEEVTRVLEDRDVRVDSLDLEEVEGHRSVKVRFYGGKKERRELVAALDEADVPVREETD